MAIVQDPDTGQWYDDETGMLVDNPYLFDEGTVGRQFAGSMIPFLAQYDVGQPQFPAAYDKYGNMKPYSGADLNRTITGYKGLMDIVGDPISNLFLDTLSGGTGFDYASLVGAGAGAAEPVQTPYLSADYSAPADAQYRGLQEAIGNQNQTPEQAISGLLATNEIDDETIKSLRSAAGEMWREKQALLQPAKPNALQQKLIASGLGDPLEQYTGQNLPADVDMTAADERARYLMQQAMAGMARQQPALDKAQDEAMEQWAPDWLRKNAGMGPRAEAPAAVTGGAVPVVTPQPNVNGPVLGTGGRSLAGLNLGTGGRSLAGMRPMLVADRIAGQGGELGTGGRSLAGLDLGTGGRSLVGLDLGPTGDNRFLRSQSQQTSTPQADAVAGRQAQIMAQQQQAQRWLNEAKAAPTEARNFAALRMQQQGRTPFKDNLQRKMALYRNMGFGF